MSRVVKQLLSWAPRIGLLSSVALWSCGSGPSQDSLPDETLLPSPAVLPYLKILSPQEGEELPSGPLEVIVDNGNVDKW